MICPLCTTKRGRRIEWELTDLMTHMLEKHPLQILETMREGLKKEAITSTDIAYIPKVTDGT